MANDISAIKPELDALTQIIVDTVPVEQIYLFGSYAYGTPNEDSDYDFYVVVKDAVSIREIEAMSAIDLATFRVRTKPVDVLALTLNRFLYRKEQPTLERTIARGARKRPT
ncbi:MAG: nucleotidyltransferase domain-containing protein [Spirochaetaceae bacterium]|nr:nucleotidyltransferase domain-containing protein [Spirochaetaceae bacterium]